jgi:hypothetical protein
MIIQLPLAHKGVAARGMGGMARIKKALESLVMLSEVWCLGQELLYLVPRQFYRLELVILDGKAQSNPRVILVELQK